ncbi:hypothetical protein WME95_46420 [Sorangium sp. So ce327]|uniref:hypothetical protein n=1 Tax=Sorangium sp. So ce327 TaxID=3133301 RepID=UPI003F5F1BBF
MMLFSNRTLAVLRSSRIATTPWARHELDRFVQLHEDFPPIHAELESALYDAASRRGLPVLDDHVFGAFAAAREGGAPLWIDVHTPDGGSRGRAFLVAWSRRRALPLYLRSDGGVLIESGLEMHPNMADWVAQVALFSDPRWLPVRLEVRTQRCGRAVADALSLPPVSTIDDAASVWAGEHAIVADESLEMTWIRVDDLSQMERALEACHALMVPLQLVGAQVERICLEEGSAPSLAPELGFQYRLDGEPVRLLMVEPEESRARQVWSKGPRILEEKTFENERLIVRRYERAASHLRCHVSSRVLQWLDAKSFFRDPDATRGPKSLMAELDRHGIPPAAPLLRFEELLGGLVAYDEVDPARVPCNETRLGVYRVLEERLGFDDDDAEDSRFLEAAGWPVVYCHGRRLTLGGKFLGSMHLYAGDTGEIFLYRHEIDDLVLVSDDAVKCLEKWAVEWQASGLMPSGSPVELSADVAAALADELGLQRIDEASDSASEHWLSDDIWLRRVQRLRAGASTATVTSLTTRLSGQLVEIVRSAQVLAPGVRIVVRSAGGVQPYYALKDAGFDVELV